MSNAMELGMIGLGRMGASMSQRILRNGHRLVGFDPNAEAGARAKEKGVELATSIEALVGQLKTPRAIWMMLPAAIVDQTLALLAPLLQAGDIVIDGGNSYYRDGIRRAAELQPRGIHYLDVGTSGGVAGLERGYCLMIGGEPNIVQHLTPIFAALAPGVAAASPTPGRKAGSGSAEQGYLHCGPNGAGHFVKMVHNGIEYGLMAAYAEGLNVLRHADAGKRTRDVNAETILLSHLEFYQYEFDLAEITELWRRGSVIDSWLLDLTAKALLDAPDLENYAGRVSDSGEGRWTIAAALDEAVPVPVLSAALFERFSSRGAATFADKVLSAMRHQFGGHSEIIPDQQAGQK